ncbi:hypothetical protein JCM19232_2340 [Vibrio ishigakensis]|uniref:Uncharacterized protein n=1 Tax=Vibrio ishigakensis TaxID=1481914 RepID=A0A0B8PAZ9_9VIBR|nr:hypothetical protein JCM19232_2340 [Vibrio ishigakensis]
MTDPTYLSGWKPELCFQLNTNNNVLADLNRFLFKHFPPTKKLQQGHQFEDANRIEFVLKLKEILSEKLKRRHQPYFYIWNFH